MKNSAALLLIFILSSLSAFAEKPLTLPPKPEIGRYSPVIKNKAIIRFSGKVNDIEAASAKLKNIFAVADKQLLDKKLSLSYSTLNKKNQILASGKSINKILAAEEPLLRTYYISFSGNQEPEEFCRKLLMSNSEIEIAEPVTVSKVLGAYIPNDPRAKNQSVLGNIKLFNAWDIIKGDTNVIIGISDNGIFQDHEDIYPNIAVNYKEIPNNGKDDDGNGIPDDYKGANLSYAMDGKNPGETNNPSSSHGTSVAGIAAAATDNSKGIAGVGFKCRLFPIKTAPYNDDTIYYGYESMVYAALRGCKVLNCSWGSVKKPSSLEQTVVNYAIAHDVAIVAAGGNDYHSTETMYPAGYDGVLGVGELDALDNITSNTSIGSQILIMAEGDGNWAPNNYNSYEQLDAGTSFASPVVAGVVALVRSKYPQLNARQAIEYTRQSTDQLELGDDEQFKFFVPGKINVLKAVQSDNITIPSVRPVELIIKQKSGIPFNRITKNNEFKLSFKAYNYLATAKNLKFVLSVYKSDFNPLRVIDSIINIANIPADSPLEIGDFSLIASDVSSSYTFFRVDIYGENDYHDFFTYKYTPMTDVTTFSNNRIIFSAGDRGTFGYGMSTLSYQGAGFRFKNDKQSFQSQLYKGGLMASESNSKVISALHYTGSADNNAFLPVKNFVDPDKNIGIFADTNSSIITPIGLQIKTQFLFPAENIPVVKVLFKIRNVSKSTLKAVSAGYYIDWDIGLNSDSNKVRLFPESYPNFFKQVAIAAELAEFNKPGWPVFGMLAYSPNDSNEAQACGLNYSTTKVFSKSDQIAALNAGTDLQIDNVDDVSMFCGMRFPGTILPDEEREFTMLIGCADSSSELANYFMSVLMGNGIETDSPGISDDLVFPNPASEYILVKFNENNINQRLDYQIFDAIGNKIVSGITDFENNSIKINISDLVKGVYFIKVQNGQKTSFKSFVKN